MNVGKWNKLPHYSVVGDPQDFYLWVNEDGGGSASGWLKGKEAFRHYHTLKKLRSKSKRAFIQKVKSLHLENAKR